MIFRNPQGAPELACNECGCRWYDRQTNSCYECGTPVPQDEISEYLGVLRDFHAARGIVVNPPEAPSTAEGCGCTRSSASRSPTTRSTVL